MIYTACLFLDYIRTFTWDKKLEMVVKSTGILGGQGKSSVDTLCSAVIRLRWSHNFV